jgi:hypothetical protein
MAMLGVAFVVYGFINEMSMPAGQTDNVDIFGMTFSVLLVFTVVGSLAALLFGTASYLLLRKRPSNEKGRRS